MGVPKPLVIIRGRTLWKWECSKAKACPNSRFGQTERDALLVITNTINGKRRRLVCEPSALPTIGEEIAAPSQGGVPTGLWLAVAVLALAVLIYWFVVRRFVRPVPKTRDSQPDLEAQREDLYLRVDTQW